MTNTNDKSENAPIVLDLNNVDFERNITGGDIWQKNAMYEFNKRLTNTARQASKYESTESDNPIIIHDAIFIGGARGTGKTVFLQNIKGFWTKYKKDNNLGIKIHFCNSIDPTLLVDHDNFANVVIAHLYNEVENTLDSKQYEHSNQDAFYKALRTVSKSLGKQEHLDDGLSGLDRVIKYRSGIQLVKHFDSYINECKNSLKVDVIVLPIDDIDMALERSYEVLDVVRRLLGCPKIIPVITGDLELYEPIIQNRFEKGEDNKRNQIIKEAQAKQLTQEYLKKVIPHHNRISLEPIERLLPSMKIFDFSGDTKSAPLSYSDYVNKLRGCFFGPLNGEEKSCDWPKPETAREVTQLIRDLAPSELDNKNRAELWRRYKVWACLKQDSVAYSNAVTAQKIEDLRDENNQSYVTLNKLHAFNPMLQLDDLTPKWQGRAFFKEQVETIDEKNRNTNTNLLAGQINKQFQMYGDQKIYRSMPVVEKLDNRLVITADAEKMELKNKDNKQLKLLVLEIFAFKNYYDLTLKTKRQVFFSRAFEILASSLLNFNFDAIKLEENGRAKFWVKVLVDIFKRAPFYSIPALFPTKAFNANLADDEVDNEDEINLVDGDEDDNETDNSAIIDLLANRITVWEQENKELFEKHKFDSLMPMIFSVFNKVFTELKQFRSKMAANKYEHEHLSDLALRFKYITINAFATFIKPAPVVFQSLALTENYENFRIFQKYKNTDPAIRGNVGYFFHFSKGNTKIFDKLKEFERESDTKKANLMKVIAKHPIFEVLEEIEECFILQGKQKKGEGLSSKIIINKEIMDELKAMALMHDHSVNNREFNNMEVKKPDLSPSIKAGIFEENTSQNIDDMSVKDAFKLYQRIYRYCSDNYCYTPEELFLRGDYKKLLLKIKSQSGIY